MRALVVCLVVGSGCWAEQRVDEVFSEAEWTYLQTFRLDRLAPTTCDDARCEAMARFGQRLFFDPKLSGSKTVACTTCHDPNRFFVDSRPDNAQSFGTSWTRRNVPGLVDTAYRTQFTWIGQYQTVADVLELALAKATKLSKDDFIDLILSSYRECYDELFPGQATTRAEVYNNAASAIGVYEQQLVSGPSPFDRYLDGDTLAIDISAKRGAQLFIGKAFCSECHAGPLFTDDKFHVTGVEQRAPHNLDPEPGRIEFTHQPIDEGRFRTPSLRHIAETSPYMHAGQLATIPDVIDFYRWGGDVTGYAGVKDPRIVPLDIDDQDARDLEAFLMTLTGAPVDARWVTP